MFGWWWGWGALLGSGSLSSLSNLFDVNDSESGALSSAPEGPSDERRWPLSDGDRSKCSRGRAGRGSPAGRLCSHVSHLSSTSQALADLLTEGLGLSSNELIMGIPTQSQQS